MPNPDKTKEIVLCDASPLIFLSKIGHLDLIEKVLPGKLLVLRCVVEEILSDRAAPVEMDRLRQWLSAVEVIDFEGVLFSSTALSRCDQSTLAYAEKVKAGWILADEKLLRRVARERGIQVLGFCGLLVKAVERKHLSAKAAMTLLNQAVDSHGLRISLPLYRRLQEAIENRG